ncbi:MAG: hypothetical protein P1U91_20065 [Pseudophaeobacter sp. bin_em_oilr2.035]|nr:hypothetical protein [Pseudophaeobacter sp. bin_em_oilr2.035]
MAATTYICPIAHVASLLGENPGLLEAIVSNDDNLSYGGIVSVHIGQDKCITTLTDDGICELKVMLADAGCSPERWDDFLQDFIDDPDIIARAKHQPLRLKPGAYEENQPRHIFFRAFGNWPMFSLKPKCGWRAGAEIGKSHKFANAEEFLRLAAGGLQVIDLISLFCTGASGFSVFLPASRKKSHGAG